VFEFKRLPKTKPMRPFPRDHADQYNAGVSCRTDHQRRLILKVPSSFSPPPQFEFIVERALSGIRIDSFLIKHLRNYTSWRMQRIVGAGAVRMNGALALQTSRVFRGQTVSVKLIEPPDKLLTPCDLKLPVVYEDPWIAVINKPAGMICHPVGAVQTGTLADVLQCHLDLQTQRPGLLRPGIVHRLDRHTSGIMVTAKTHTAHAELSGSFEASRVAKSYVALVEGVIESDSGTIDWPIGRAATGRHVLMSARADARNAKPSVTKFLVLKRYAKATLVLAKPRTGRNHQIRVHFAQLGHPLIGDEFYKARGEYHPYYESAVPGEIREVETGLPIVRHALHAARLEFPHPVTGAWVQFTAPLPPDFAATLSALS